jgi:basic amino acid/polyamine antiporter, APA family
MKKKTLFRKKTVEGILQQLESASSSMQMKRSLTLRDLTALGIAAIVGAGIFSTIGTAASHGGPAVSLLFVFTAIACGFSAMAYAQFASTIPISGSAYTYAYVSFGELIAWIIGWDLIMEYAVGNIAVAISWSDYFTGLMAGLNVHIPDFLSIDYLSASRGYETALEFLAAGKPFESLSGGLQEAFIAWTTAPTFGNIRLIGDVPAFGIVLLITWLVYVGIQQSKMVSNILVLLKIVILLVVIAVGAFYVDPENWSPFAPHGVGGVLKGVAGVFFAYIGFDAISTTAEECKRPQRDLPRGMILALIISTVLYILISLVLTGMVDFSKLAVGDPLAFVFNEHNLTKLSGIIAVSAVVAMASVLLVFQIGQPRIWMNMSRDGLLPKRFGKLHPKYKTPAFATIITGIIVAVPSLFMNLTEVTDLTSIGTLFAFILVSGGVIVLDKNPKKRDPNYTGFRIPYFNSRYFVPIVWVIVIASLAFLAPESVNSFFSAETFANWEVFKHEIPFIIFILSAIVLSVFAVMKEFSLIPVLGLFTNGYLITELGLTNWLRFLIWLAIGFVIYFLYSYKNSRLADKELEVK